VPRKHLTRHLCGLISRSGGGGIQDVGTVRGDRYLIAEAAAQCSDKRLLAGLRQIRRVILIERNADAPVVAHGRTIATRRVTRTVTAADPLPDHLPDALDPHPPTLRYALTGKLLSGNGRAAADPGLGAVIGPGQEGYGLSGLGEGDSRYPPGREARIDFSAARVCTAPLCSRVTPRSWLSPTQ
jgi:hypothetical protein